MSSAQVFTAIGIVCFTVTICVSMVCNAAKEIAKELKK